MKTLMTLLVVFSGFAAHAVINTKSNSSCAERAKGSLVGMGDTNPQRLVVNKNVAPSVQKNGAKTRAIGT